MLNVESRQRNLVIGLAATFILASLGAAAFHVRWHAGADPTELLGWSGLLATAVLSLAHISLDTCASLESEAGINAFLGVGAGSIIMAIVPFALVKFLVAEFDSMMGRSMAFNVLFITVLVLAFSLSIGLYLAVERTARSAE